MTKLYSPRMLSLATSLAEFPLDRDFALSAEVRSRTCGSVVRVGLDRAADGRVSDIGLQVSACAIGQSAAAIMAAAAKGRDRADFERLLSEIEVWLSGADQLPDWPQFDALSSAQPHAGRHEAIRLPWKAAITALSSTESAS